eukprot:COSAG05_NODE_896_length_6694_cov_7.182563_2_plen_371_part_00
MGAVVLEQLRARIGPDRVFDLTLEMKSPGSLASKVREWSLGVAPGAPRPALLVCGGDGTVSWLLMALQECGLIDQFVVATVPLGTANDFARVMGWSNAYYPEILHDAMQRLQGTRGTVTEQYLDVWKVAQFRGGSDSALQFVANGRTVLMVISPATCTILQSELTGIYHISGLQCRTESRDLLPGAGTMDSLPVLNYFSLGFDAKVAHEFGRARDNGDCCTGNRLGNVLCYLKFGLLNSWMWRGLCCHAGSPNLNRLGLKVSLDSVEIELPCCATQISVINVPSYANGAKPWDGGRCSFCCSKWAPGAVDDNILEVFALFGPTHMGLIGSRQMSAVRLGQARRVELCVEQTEVGKGGALVACYHVANLAA